MLVYGKEVDFKISRLSNATAMENALDLMEKDEKKIGSLPAGTGATKVVGGMITMLRNFFKNATGTDVLEGCDDLEDAKKAYFDFLDGVEAQKASLLAPYDPDRIE